MSGEVCKPALDIVLKDGLARRYSVLSSVLCRSPKSSEMRQKAILLCSLDVAANETSN